MQLVAVPFPLIGDATISIFESAFAVHHVVKPVAFILAAFVVVKYSVARSHPIFLLAFIEPFRHFLTYYSAALSSVPIGSSFINAKFLSVAVSQDNPIFLTLLFAAHNVLLVNPILSAFR